jgi:hypothetical protein
MEISFAATFLSVFLRCRCMRVASLKTTASFFFVQPAACFSYRFGAAVPGPVNVRLGALGRCDDLREPLAALGHAHVAARHVPGPRKKSTGDLTYKKT